MHEITFANRFRFAEARSRFSTNSKDRIPEVLRGSSSIRSGPIPQRLHPSLT
jgi:hypothetical protein